VWLGLGKSVVVSVAGELSNGFLSPEDGTDNLFRNVAKKLKLIAFDP
jgi:hypothetical protein